MATRKSWRCRLFGHKPIGFTSYGGWPESWFELRSRCDRCGADTSVSIPSSITITRREEP